MPDVTAALVKELRDKTQAGMMDCKRALSETAGDMEEAVDWLRKKGLATAAKKAGRVAADGLVGVATRGQAGAVVEVNAETDFVARNDLFQAFVRTVAGLAVGGNGDLDAFKGAAFPGTGRSVADELTELVGRIGENLVLRRVARLAVEKGLVASYMHNSLAPGLGKIGVLVALESQADGEALGALGRQLAMHVAFANPAYLDASEVPPAALERERSVLREQALASGRSAEVVDKMVEGRLRKFYEDNVLLDQIFVSPDADGKARVAGVVAAAAKAAGAPIRLIGFKRFAIGEGIDKPTTDLAAEVAAQLKH
jgi:elongation factor Ts